MWLKNLGSVSHRFKSLLDGTKAFSVGFAGGVLHADRAATVFQLLLRLETIRTGEGKDIGRVSSVTLQDLLCAAWHLSQCSNPSEFLPFVISGL
jgi:hypothetical protein